MADTTKEKILKINTQGAEKNVKSLKTQIRELKEQLAQLDKGTAEYDKVSKQLADTNQKQIEINEAMKYSNKDLGATLSNLTKVSAGVVGAISSVNSVMVLMGADSEEAQEAMKKIQSLMAIIQGLSAIDTAVKALKGLTVAFQGFNDVRVKSITTSLGASGAELVEAGALAENTKEMVKNNETAVLYNEAQRTNVTETNKSTEALLENNLAQLKGQEAMIDRMVANRKTSAEMAVLNNQLKEGTITAEEYQKATGVSAEVVAKYKARIDETVAALERLRGMQTANMKLAEELMPVYDAQTGTIKENSLVKAANEKATSTNTAAIKGNTAAKKANAEATGEVVASETALGNTAKKNDPILRKAWKGVTNGIKNAAKALKAFISANPILAGIMAAIAAIGYAISKWASNYAKAREKAAELQKMNNEIHMELKRQQTDMTALLRMFYAQNTTQKEKEVLAKEINKLAKEELVTRNEITGQWELSNVKLLQYNKSLRTSIELEYHKKAILESMEKEEEARNNAIHEENHLIGNLLRTANGYYEDADEELAKQEEHWKAIEKLTAGTVKNIERENKSTNTVKTTAGGIKKTFQELYKELSELYKRLYNNIINAAELRKVYNGIYTEASVAFEKIFNSINANRYALKISDEFKTALKNGLKDIKATDISLDMIFGDNFNELESKLNSAKGRLKSMLTATKIDEKELAKQKTYVDELEKELKTMTDIANAVLKYKQTVESTREAQEERNKANEHYNRELMTTMRYMEKQRRENGRSHVYADIEREIELNTQLRNETNQRLREEKARLEELQASNVKNKETIEEIAELQKRIDEDEKTANEAELNISNARWQKRLTQLDEEYEKIKRNSEEEQQALEIDRRQTGGGVADYNTDRDLIEMQLEAMVEYANHIDEFYAERQAQYAEDSEQWLLLENERLAAQEQLQAEYREKELEADRVHADRRLNIQKAYIAAYQALSGQLSGILGEVMNMYDENSKEYLNLRYAQGVTDTLSGTLSAYMSGIESGIPWPGNTILAATLAASTFAMGVMQLANMKNGTLANANATPVEIGREYDTLSYQTNVDTLSAIRDQRVWVLESDISDAQRRVQVQESNATF